MTLTFLRPRLLFIAYVQMVFSVSCDNVKMLLSFLVKWPVDSFLRPKQL